jgi:hypothetical protein
MRTLFAVLAAALIAVGVTACSLYFEGHSNPVTQPEGPDAPDPDAAVEPSNDAGEPGGADADHGAPDADPGVPDAGGGCGTPDAGVIVDAEPPDACC